MDPATFAHDLLTGAVALMTAPFVVIVTIAATALVVGLFHKENHR